MSDTRDDFEKGYDHAIAEVVAHFRDMQKKADAIGNRDIRWPSAAAMHVETTFGRDTLNRLTRTKP